MKDFIFSNPLYNTTIINRYGEMACPHLRSFTYWAIDWLQYELYGLIEDEIKVVEGEE
jgi:hypothetical protein